MQIWYTSFEYKKYCFVHQNPQSLAPDYLAGFFWSKWSESPSHELTQGAMPWNRMEKGTTVFLGSWRPA